MADAGGGGSCTHGGRSGTHGGGCRQYAAASNSGSTPCVARGVAVVMLLAVCVMGGVGTVAGVVTDVRQCTEVMCVVTNGVRFEYVARAGQGRAVWRVLLGNGAHASHVLVCAWVCSV